MPCRWQRHRQPGAGTDPFPQRRKALASPVRTASDVDLGTLRYPYLIKYAQAQGKPPAFTAKLCRKARAIGTPENTYCLNFRRRVLATVGHAPPEDRCPLGLPGPEAGAEDIPEPGEQRP